MQTAADVHNRCLKKFIAAPRPGERDNSIAFKANGHSPFTPTSHRGSA